MKRIEIAERDDWRAQAEALGFNFHTMHGDPYWDETACYRFTLRQIEDDIEDPSAVIESMCFDVVSRAVEDSEVMAKLAIPESFWDYIRGSWLSADKNLYGRLDFSYDGNGPAKLLEYNADTPTSLYESSAFQWLWLEHALEREIIPPGCDQFNSIHEQMVQAFRNFEIEGRLHLASCEGSAEDEGTVRYGDQPDDEIRPHQNTKRRLCRCQTFDHRRHPSREKRSDHADNGPWIEAGSAGLYTQDDA